MCGCSAGQEIAILNRNLTKSQIPLALSCLYRPRCLHRGLFYNHAAVADENGAAQATRWWCVVVESGDITWNASCRGIF